MLRLPARPLTSPATSFHDVVDALTRRQFVLGTAATAVAASACAGGSEPASAATVPWTRGAFGPVEVPQDPQRVVTGFAVDTDFCLALGLPVVGAWAPPGEPFLGYHDAQLAGVAVAPTGELPNFEAIAALRPDLIIDSYAADRAVYDRYSAIAPTISYTELLYEGVDRDWEEILRIFGAVFDRGERVARAVADYDDAVRAGRARLPDLQGRTFAAIVGQGPAGFNVNPRTDASNRVIEDLGLVQHPLVGEEFQLLSQEEVSRLAEVDYLFHGRYGELGMDDDLVRELFANPLWQQLPAVAQGRVVDYPAAALNYPSPLTALELARLLPDLAT